MLLIGLTALRFWVFRDLPRSLPPQRTNVPRLLTLRHTDGVLNNLAYYLFVPLLKGRFPQGDAGYKIFNIVDEISDEHKS